MKGKDDAPMPSVTVNIPQATFVSSAQPDSNLSFYPTVYVGTDMQYQACIGLMQIMLPTLPATQVDSAILNLTVISKTGASPSPVVVNRVTSAFNISTVTYNTRPAFTPVPSTVNIAESDLYTTVHIDVTALVNGWLNGTVPNDGIALTNSDGQTVIQFATNNIIYPPYFPTLTLTYSSSPASSTAICFSYAQLANVITQLMQLYPTAVMTFYTAGFSVTGITGTPVELYASPDASYGTLAVLTDGSSYGVVPLNQIVAIGLPAGTIYNQSIRYLPAPQFPAGCDKNLITSWHDYLLPTTPATIYAGSLVSESGVVYRNEYGLLVMADDNTGLNPVFMPVVNIRCFTTSVPPTAKKDELTANPGLIVPGSAEGVSLNGKK